MVQLTIDVAEELATRLQPVQNRLVDILELGLRGMLSGEHPLQPEVAEFLASSPTVQELVCFRPSETVANRVNELLKRNRQGLLTDVEQAELDQYETIDYLMSLVKAKARLRLT